MGNEARNDDNVLRTMPESLVGDMYIAAFGVPNFRRHSTTLRRNWDVCRNYGPLTRDDRVAEYAYGGRIDV